MVNLANAKLLIEWTQRKCSFSHASKNQNTQIRYGLNNNSQFPKLPKTEPTVPWNPPTEWEWEDKYIDKNQRQLHSADFRSKFNFKFSLKRYVENV